MLQFLDIGYSPLANSFVPKEKLFEAQVFYPLRVYFCKDCFLVQIDEFEKIENIFGGEYTYFSSVSSSWLEHARIYAEQITDRLKLDSSSFVIEVACNDGYLLQYFNHKNIPCLGIEPSSSTSAAAIKKNIKVIQDFFSQELAKNLQKADLIICNNVFAHVPDVLDFIRGLKVVLNPCGTVTIEFPHLLPLLKNTLFDTVYHEHFSYFSLSSVVGLMDRCGLKIYDADELTTHGGSLRIYVANKEYDIQIDDKVGDIVSKEISFGLTDERAYNFFQKRVDDIKSMFLSMLLDFKSKGYRVVGYGAAAKATTFLNYCGVKSDMIEYIVDRAESKIGKYLPGCSIPIVSESSLTETKPDVIIVFAWNIVGEVANQLEYCGKWGAKMVVVFPEIKQFDLVKS
jgi:SAM-dependent methyltransferase